MVRESQAGSLGEALGGFVGRAAVGATLGALALLALGLVAELLRRRHRAVRLLALLDLTVPTGVRAIVIAVLATLAGLQGARPVGATESVRGWLGAPSAVTTSTTRAPVATPDAVSEHDAAPPTTTPTGPVVLIPPVTIERLDPAPVEQVPPTPPSPIVQAPSAPATPSGDLPTYVVQRGDCLWSIAARLLGDRAGGAAIDTAWRRIYAANRAAIGDNPNLIHIGLTLALPPLDAQP